MTTLSRPGRQRRAAVGRWLGSPVRLRRLLALRQYERRSRWVEQARRTPTVGELYDALAGR
jgi:hypothetical protein